MIYEFPVPKIETDFPLLNNYYSDWHQLGFYYDEEAKESAIYIYEEDFAFGLVHSQIFAVNLAKLKLSMFDKHFDLFISLFNRDWLHEYLHLIGLNEEALKIVQMMGVPV